MVRHSMREEHDPDAAQAAIVKKRRPAAPSKRPPPLSDPRPVHVQVYTRIGSVG